VSKLFDANMSTERSLETFPLNSKETILGKAILLFAEKGFTGLSMRQLAKQIGISAATI
jgi:AcrR family transcriptional regulator